MSTRQASRRNLDFVLVGRVDRRDGPAHVGGPGDDLEAAVRMLADRGATLDPVAAVQVAHAELVVDGGVVDVAADHAIDLAAARLGNQSLLELADEVDRVFDL